MQTMENESTNQPKGSVPGKQDIYQLLTTNPGDDFTTVRDGSPLTTITLASAYEARATNNVDGIVAVSALSASLLDPCFLEGRQVETVTNDAGVVIASQGTLISVARSSTNVFNVLTTHEPNPTPTKTGVLTERATALAEQPFTVSARVGAANPALSIPAVTIDWLGTIALSTTTGLNSVREMLSLMHYKAAYGWMAMTTPQLARLVRDTGVQSSLKAAPAEESVLAAIQRIYMPPTVTAGMPQPVVPPGFTLVGGAAPNPDNFWADATNTRQLVPGEAASSGAYSFPGGYTPTIRFMTSSAYLPGIIESSNVIMVPGTLFTTTAAINQTLLAIWVAAFFPSLVNVAINANVTEEWLDGAGAAVPAVKTQSWLPTTNANNVRYKPRESVLVVLPTTQGGTSNDPHMEALVRPQYGPNVVSEFNVPPAGPVITVPGQPLPVIGGFLVPPNRVTYAAAGVDAAAYIASHAPRFTPELIDVVMTKLAAISDQRQEALDILAGVSAKLRPQLAVRDYALTVGLDNPDGNAAAAYSTVDTGSYQGGGAVPPAVIKTMVSSYRHDYVGPDLRYRDHVTDDATRTLFLPEGDCFMLSAAAAGFLTVSEAPASGSIPSEYLNAMNKPTFTAALSSIAMSQALYVDALIKSSPVPACLMNMHHHDICVGTAIPYSTFKPVWQDIAHLFLPMLGNGSLRYGALLTTAAQVQGLPFVLAYHPKGFVARRSVPTELIRPAGFNMSVNYVAGAGAVVLAASPAGHYAKLGFAAPVLYEPTALENTTRQISLNMRHPGLVTRSWWKAWEHDAVEETRQIAWWDAMSLGPADSAYVDNPLAPAFVRIALPSSQALTEATMRESLILGKFFRLSMQLAANTAEFAAAVTMLLANTTACDAGTMAVVPTTPVAPPGFAYPVQQPEAQIGAIDHLEYVATNYVRVGPGTSRGWMSHLQAGHSAMFVSLSTSRALGAALTYPVFMAALRNVYYRQAQLADTVPRLLSTQRPRVLVDTITAETLSFSTNYFVPRPVAPPPALVSNAGQPTAEAAARLAADLAAQATREANAAGLVTTTTNESNDTTNNP